jgi:hypothetical protein
MCVHAWCLDMNKDMDIAVNKNINMTMYQSQPKLSGAAAPCLCSPGGRGTLPLLSRRPRDPASALQEAEGPCCILATSIHTRKDIFYIALQQAALSPSDSLAPHHHWRQCFSIKLWLHDPGGCPIWRRSTLLLSILGWALREQATVTATGCLHPWMDSSFYWAGIVPVIIISFVDGICSGRRWCSSHYHP